MEVIGKDLLKDEDTWKVNLVSYLNIKITEFHAIYISTI